MDATKTLSRFVAETDYESFPVSVVEAAKVAILDGIANMLAGSAQELAGIIGRYVQDLGGALSAVEDRMRLLTADRLLINLLDGHYPRSWWITLLSLHRVSHFSDREEFHQYPEGCDEH